MYKIYCKSQKVHPVPLGVVMSDRLKEYISHRKDHWTRAIALHPTGSLYVVYILPPYSSP